MNDSATSEILQRLSAIETKLTILTSEYQGKLEDHEARIRTIELKGGRRWEGVINQVVICTTTALVTWLMTKLIGGQ